MSTRNEVLLVTRERETERVVVLGSEIEPQVFAQVSLCRDLKELASQLEERSFPVVLVDVDPQPMTALTELEPLVRRYPDTRFVVVLRDFQNDVVLEAMQVGARHCLVKSSITTDLPSVLRRLMRDVAQEGGVVNPVVTVFGATGGCGATTIALNLADEMASSLEGRVLLVDLDRHYGTAASYLGINAQFGVADVLANRGVIDAQLIHSTATEYKEGFNVLVSPASVNMGSPEEIVFDQLGPFLAACRSSYEATVIDAPRVPMDVASTLAKTSVLSLIVFELNVIAVRAARAMWQGLVDRGVPVDSILPVANRFRKRNPMLGYDDAREALGGIEVAKVANDYDNIVRAINYGKTLSEVAPRSSVRKDLRSLAERIQTLAKNEQ